MNTTTCFETDSTSVRSEHLLDCIISFRANVGDRLNDHEFTRLLRETPLPAEEGFAFLSFSDGFVMLSVPPQDLADWYPKKGWILPRLETIARALAEKYELFLTEPPDVTSGYLSPGPEFSHSCHHLELSRRQEAIIIAHPRFLKIRVYAGKSAILYAHAARSPLLLGPQLLQDLSALYRSHCSSAPHDGNKGFCEVNQSLKKLSQFQAIESGQHRESTCKH